MICDWLQNYYTQQQRQHIHDNSSLTKKHANTYTYIYKFTMKNYRIKTMTHMQI